MKHQTDYQGYENGSIKFTIRRPNEKWQIESRNVCLNSSVTLIFDTGSGATEPPK